MKLELTNRGFVVGDFLDEYGTPCSIQKSSLATKDCIWLGVHDAVPKICVYGEGWKEVPLPEGAMISSRMHHASEWSKLRKLLERLPEKDRDKKWKLVHESVDMVCETILDGRDMIKDPRGLDDEGPRDAEGIWP